MSASDTIFALSSGGGRAGVAVVRVSGPNAGPALAAVDGQSVGWRGQQQRTSSGGSSDGVSPAPATAPLQSVPTPRRSSALTCSTPRVACSMKAWWSGFGPKLLHWRRCGRTACSRLTGGGARGSCAVGATGRPAPAEAGEFTQRAFLRGKLDLAAVEGLGDLIDAQTEAQRRLSLRQLGGALSSRWRNGVRISSRCAQRPKPGSTFPTKTCPRTSSDCQGSGWRAGRRDGVPHRSIAPPGGAGA